MLTVIPMANTNKICSLRKIYSKRNKKMNEMVARGKNLCDTKEGSKGRTEEQRRCGTYSKSKSYQWQKPVFPYH